MKKIFITILLLLAATSYADQKAITDTGEEVILKSDGTWEYSDNAQKATNIIETIKKKFERPKDSSFLLKSVKNNSAFWINTDKWSFEKPKVKHDAEYMFKLKDKDLYGMAITEGIEMPIESLADLALEYGRDAAPDLKIVRKEYRVVNGNKLICMEMNGTIQGIKFTYLGYYYSNSSGCTQLVTWTGTNLVAKFKSEIYDFLNGLVTQ